MSRRTLRSAARRTRSLALVWLLWLAVPAWGAVPGQINFQGLLLDSGGQPVNGAVSLMFTLYDAETGGTALWTESHTGVPVLDGVYDVALGSSTPIAAEVLAAGSVWVEIKVGAETLTPRKQVLSVPYALRAQTAEIAETAKSADGVALPPTPPLIGFLKLEGVEGSSTTANHLGWIPLRGLSWGMSTSGSFHEGGGGGIGPLSLQNLVLTIDDASVIPQLYSLLCTGQHLVEAMVDISPPGGPVDDVLHQISLANVLINSFEYSTAPKVGEPHLAILALTAEEWTFGPTGGSAVLQFGLEFLGGSGSCNLDFNNPIIHPGDSSRDFSTEKVAVLVSQLSPPVITNSGGFEPGGGSSGQTTLQDLTITLNYDGPCFVALLVNQDPFTELRFEVWTAANGNLPETKIALSPAIIRAVNLRSVGDRLEQTVFFDGDKITWQHLDGTVFSWEQSTETGG